MRTRLLPVCLALVGIIACGQDPDPDTLVVEAPSDGLEFEAAPGCRLQPPDFEPIVAQLEERSPAALELAAMRLSFEVQYAMLLMQMVTEWPFAIAWQTVDASGQPRTERRLFEQQLAWPAVTTGCDAETERIFYFLLFEDGTQLAECLGGSLFGQRPGTPDTKEQLEREANMRLQCLMEMQAIDCEGDCDFE